MTALKKTKLLLAYDCRLKLISATGIWNIPLAALDDLESLKFSSYSDSTFDFGKLNLILPTVFFVVADLCGVRFCRGMSESHASSHWTQVCQQSGGHQILRSRHVSQARVLKAQTGFITFYHSCFVCRLVSFTPLNVVNVS